MSDASFASVTLLLLGNGTDTSTTIVDSSNSAHTITRNGNTQLSTTSPKFGTAAILFDGTGDYLAIPANASTELEFSADFTWDLWMKPSALARGELLAANQSTRNSHNYHLIFATNSTDILEFYDGAGTNLQLSIASAGLNDGNWHHIAVTRSGTTVRIYIDGVHKGNFTSSTTYGDSLGVAVGAHPVNVSATDYAGRMDCVRMTKGVARWTGTSSFTPPTSEDDYLAAGGGPFPVYIRRAMTGGMSVLRGF